MLPELFQRELRYLPSKIETRIRLTKNQPSYYLFEAESTDGKARHRFNIEDIYLEAEHVALFETVAKSFELSLSNRPAMIPYLNVEEHPVLVAPNTKVFRQDRIISSIPFPELIYCVLLRTSSLLGHAKQESTAFHHYGLTQLELLVDQDLFDSNSLLINCDFDSDEGCAEAYSNLQREIEGTPASKYLTLNRFRKNASVFLFRLIPERKQNAQFTFPQVIGTLGIKATFKNPTTEQLTILMYTVRKNYIQIIGPERLVSVVS
jgi:hypothetical protein